MVNLGFEAFEKTRVHGVTYKTVKRFKSQNKAERYAKSLPQGKSRRFPVIVESVRIGLHLGNIYCVKVPKL